MMKILNYSFVALSIIGSIGAAATNQTLPLVKGYSWEYIYRIFRYQYSPISTTDSNYNGRMLFTIDSVKNSVDQNDSIFFQVTINDSGILKIMTSAWNSAIEVFDTIYSGNRYKDIFKRQYHVLHDSLFATDSDDITHNLLIYQPKLDDSVGIPNFRGWQIKTDSAKIMIENTQYTVFSVLNIQGWGSPSHQGNSYDTVQWISQIGAAYYSNKEVTNSYIGAIISGYENCYILKSFNDVQIPSFPILTIRSQNAGKSVSMAVSNSIKKVVYLKQNSTMTEICHTNRYLNIRGQKTNEKKGSQLIVYKLSKK